MGKARLTHREYPCNHGGVAIIGMAVLPAWRIVRMLPALDLTTSFMSNAIITGVTAVMLGFIRHANRDLRGLGYWMLGQAASSIGFLWLYCVMTTLDSRLGIIGFLFVFGGNLLNMVGYHGFLGLGRPIGRWALLFFVLVCAAFSLLVMAELKMAAYRVILLGVQVGPAVASAWLLLRHGRGEARAAYRTVAGVYLIWAVLCALRLVYVVGSGINQDVTGWTTGPANCSATPPCA